VKTETESSLRNVVYKQDDVFDKTRTMDNIQKYNIYLMNVITLITYLQDLYYTK
jgi:hypothetical protein